jgi:hypothetical protein
MAADFASMASGLGNGDDGSSSPPQGDSGATIQRMILCDKSVNFAGVKLPALVVAVVGGILLGTILTLLITHLFGTLATAVEFFLGLLRVAIILLIAYAIQKFKHIRNMYSGMWPCGLKPTQTDPTAQAVNKVLCKLGGIKQAACKLGGLSTLVQSVGGLPVLIKSSGGLACIINEYGTFEEFVCAMGGASALQAQLPNSSDFYCAMGGGSGGCGCGGIAMPMDGS